MARAVRVVVCGSLARDRIMSYRGRFGGLLPRGDGAFNATFAATGGNELFGGCGGNIAFGLAALGARPLLCAAAGGDFADYGKWLRAHGISLAGVSRNADLPTANATIITDDAGSQITCFNPGAMNEAHKNPAIEKMAAAAPLAIVAPDSRAAMLKSARALAAAKTPFMLDTGQAVDLFSRGELRRLLSLADFAIFNRSEFAVFSRRAELTEARVRSQVRALIMTDGASGATAQVGGEKIKAQAASAGRAIDPTGCGDAFRAGLLFALARRLAWPQAMRIAAVVAGIKVAARGAQGYTLTPARLRAGYKKNYGEAWPL